jgi:hypothetical protein
LPGLSLEPRKFLCIEQFFCLKAHHWSYNNLALSLQPPEANVSDGFSEEVAVRDDDAMTRKIDSPVALARFSRTLQTVTSALWASVGLVWPEGGAVGR